MRTHNVFNQVPDFDYSNVIQQLPLLYYIVSKYASRWGTKRLQQYESELPHLMLHGQLANQNSPQFHSHDKRGNRIDQVEFHPSYHELLNTAMHHELHALPWANNKKGRFTVRSALMFLHSFADPGTCCPLSMTFAAYPVLHQAQSGITWKQRLIKRDYDPTFMPAYQKKSVMIGMGMTEKQGGSDVRANTTRATPLGQIDTTREFHLTGHKWFCSAPMSDAFLMTAQTSEGIGCFLVPRWAPDDSVNPFFIQRLKSKLGNHSNASSEIELENTYAELIGEPGQGIKQIIQMVALTRLDCMVGSAALLAQSLLEAVHYAKHRQAFGQALIDQPLMRHVLADLCIEMEASLALGFWVSHAIEQSEKDPNYLALVRLGTALGKFWICKRAPQYVNEAQECLGGLGYVEDSLLPRIYREAPLNSIWEGCGNIQCLEIQRALKDEALWKQFCQTVIEHCTAHPSFEKFYQELIEKYPSWSNNPYAARHLASAMALCLQASALHEYAIEEVFEQFCQTRLAGHGCIGTGIDEVTTQAILAKFDI